MGTPLGPKYIPYAYMDPSGSALSTDHLPAPAPSHQKCGGPARASPDTSVWALLRGFRV